MERGVITQGNRWGWLQRAFYWNRSRPNSKNTSYQKNPGRGSIAPRTSIALPVESMAGRISNNDKTEAIIIHTDASARWRPAQILWNLDCEYITKRGYLKWYYRRPKPNAPLTAGSRGTLPSLSGRNRSGLKDIGSGYSSGSCSIFLSIRFRTNTSKTRGWMSNDTRHLPKQYSVLGWSNLRIHYPR